ncbi:ATP-binding protein [Streptomyces sp. 4503]|uniref:ATP-binding protein n=1 Tax=Streptomyces niphimycinicus TaxID=2842201 RepID=A0ABS6CBM8_9ACTN|nr:AAA family ATPase [Streptomyces niphimycinicus]MBU3864303.1 ATP-binding protein [Streptomyces niphimycinicus]
MYVTDLELSGVRGFHGHRAARLRFPRREDGSYAGWTVLAGRNGSGKSTVLQALALVPRLPVRRPRRTDPAGRPRGGAAARGGRRRAIPSHHAPSYAPWRQH